MLVLGKGQVTLTVIEWAPVSSDLHSNNFLYTLTPLCHLCAACWSAGGICSCILRSKSISIGISMQPSSKTFHLLVCFTFITPDHKTCIFCNIKHTIHHSTMKKVKNGGTEKESFNCSLFFFFSTAKMVLH